MEILIKNLEFLVTCGRGLEEQNLSPLARSVSGFHPIDNEIFPPGKIGRGGMLDAASTDEV